jgi:hypothetical protein
MTRRRLFRSVHALLGATLLAACAQPGPVDRLEPLQVAKKTAAIETADLEKVLVIRHPSVVNDPTRTVCTGRDPRDCGPWTFGAAMASLAGTDDPAAVSAMTLALLSKWEQDQNVNGFVVSARPAIASMVKQPWVQASGPGPTLDFSRAPFRLLAIASRIDLRAPDLSDAGEGRFIFGVLDALGNPTQFTVIFEYRLIAPRGCEDVATWAWAWANLLTRKFRDPSAAPGDTDEYNAWLQVLTDHFATIGMDPARPNGSSINQVRTNEIALSFPWELREFRLVCPGGGAGACTGAQLQQVTAKQTPHVSFRGSPALAAYINQNEAAILAGTHQVPETFQGAPFLAGNALADFTPWNATGINNPAARAAFALSTCDGCHTTETGTGFLHVTPRTANGTAQLSSWLTTVEFPRRVDDYFALVGQLAEQGCFDEVALRPQARPTH